MRTLRLTAGLVMLLGWTAADATAQAVAQPGGEVRAAILQGTNVGDKITVTLRDGVRMKGRLVSAKDALVIQQDSDQRTIPFDDINRVTRRKNGIALGAVAGTAAGLGLGLPVRGALNGEGVDGNGALLGFTLAGAAIGIGLDALLSTQRPIYSRQNQPRSRVAVAPTKGGFTGRVTLNW